MLVTIMPDSRSSSAQINRRLAASGSDAKTQARGRADALVSVSCVSKNSLIWVVSKSVWDALNHTLRCHRWTDLCKLIARCVKQCAEFSFGAFSSSGHHQHIQIEKLAETIDTVIRHNQYPPATACYSCNFQGF
jgi:hypothetical protein